MTKENIKANLNYDILHFSCHAFFDEKDPLSSGVVLDENIIFTAKEIMDLRINSHLVTLSACETGQNEIKTGDELIGLTRAFLYAGAESIIVTLWEAEASSGRA